MNASQVVGRFGEKAVLEAVKASKISHTFSKNGQSFNLNKMTLAAPIQMQNKSGQGLDLVAKITAPKPPAPHWVAFEVKSRMAMGEKIAFPGLSDAQKGAKYLVEKVEEALAGINTARKALRTGAATGRTWEGLIPVSGDLDAFRLAIRRGDVTKVVAKVDLDNQGRQIGNIMPGEWQ